MTSVPRSFPKYQIMTSAILVISTLLSACSPDSSASFPTSIPTNDRNSSPVSTLTKETQSINTETPPPSNTPADTPTGQSPTPVIEGEWSNEPPMLVARSAHAVVSTGSVIYAIAGTDEHGKPILEVERFDGTEWVSETTLPGRGLNAPTASIFNNKIYVIGGFTAVTNAPTDEVQVYDLHTRQWSMAAPLPNPRGGHAAWVLDGQIHVFGGGNSVSTIADHSIYDPSSNTWSELAPLPRAEGSPAAVELDGKIYVIGGRSGFSDYGDVYIYDLSTDTWSSGPSIDPRGTSGAVVYCGSIYIFGGESQSKRQNLDSVFRLDLNGNTWETVTPMPIALKFARAVLFDDAVYIVGGSTVPANSHSSIGSDMVLKFSQADCP